MVKIADGFNGQQLTFFSILGIFTVLNNTRNNETNPRRIYYTNEWVTNKYVT